MRFLASLSWVIQTERLQNNRKVGKVDRNIDDIYKSE